MKEPKNRKSFEAKKEQVKNFRIIDDTFITASITDPGIHFGEVPEVYIIYITESDFFGRGKTIYHVEKTIRETEGMIDDGFHEIFVNTQNNDNTKISELMTCFLQKEIENEEFQAVAARMRELKETEKGVTTVCEIMERYSEERYLKGLKEGREEGREEIAEKMLRRGRMTLQEISGDTGLTLEEVMKLEKTIVTGV